MIGMLLTMQLFVKLKKFRKFKVTQFSIKSKNIKGAVVNRCQSIDLKIGVLNETTVAGGDCFFDNILILL